MAERRFADIMIDMIMVSYHPPFLNEQGWPRTRACGLIHYEPSAFSHSQHITHSLTLDTQG